MYQLLCSIGLAVLIGLAALQELKSEEVAIIAQPLIRQATVNYLVVETTWLEPEGPVQDVDTVETPIGPV